MNNIRLQKYIAFQIFLKTMAVKWFLAFVLIGLLGLGVGCRARSTNQSPPAPSTPIMVAAAASLTDVLTEIQALYEQTQPGIKVQYNFAGSGTLRQQIEGGAEVDVFFSAAAAQMDRLQAQDRLAPGTRRDLLKNRLVLIAPRQTKAPIAQVQEIATDKVQRLAIGNPQSVPVGQYTQAVLLKTGLWPQVQSKTVFASNVRQVLQLVESGNVDAGIVYLTDAKKSKKIRTVEVISETLHPPIVYPIAALRDSRKLSQAQDFVQFLSSQAVEPIFIRAGFTIYTLQASKRHSFRPLF